MADYISRETAINTQKRMCLGCPVDRKLCYKCAVTKTEKQLLELPAADVVTRELFNRILIENDVMREQLARIGKKPGDKMDDVRTYEKAEWVSDELAPPRIKFCSRCLARKPINREASFCPNCGANMRTKEDAE